MRSLLRRRDLIWFTFQGALIVTVGIVGLAQAYQQHAWLWFAIDAVLLTMFVLMIIATIYGIVVRNR